MEYEAGKSILHDVSFYLAAGSFHFLTGPSGAGKSSVLRLISLAHAPSSGKVRLFGKDMSRVARDDIPMLRRRIGMVYQDFRLLDHLTVADNVALPLKIAGAPKKHIRENVEEMLEWLGIGEFINAKPQTLSGGQKQRVAIARAVINKPDILLADEPTGSLDPELSLQFMYLFEALNKSRGTTIVIATHDDYLVSHLNVPALWLRDGRMTLVNPGEARAA
ncbi:MAG: ATP-binding cassette domain-containing protein [Alphaproteobacteria bacterium]|nr:ATP-binding cassette domain-containing protein [Alphaproteobacteria bacterium]